MKKRLDTKLEAEGAEFLVLGQLLLRRVFAYKTYTNLPGYDLVATSRDATRAAKIQVKSRWRIGAPFFLIKKFNCDFVVAVRLNRGKKATEPEYFVLPVEVVKSILRPGPWSKVVFKDIDAKYRNNWSLIEDFLAGK